MYTLHEEDVVAWARRYEGERFHAIFCDAPYEYGFMGKSWDATGIAFQADTWGCLMEHLHPGAFGMTFGGARTYHRIAVAIEDAGFVIHPSLFGWAHGQGMPKGARIDTKIQPVDEQKVVGKYTPPNGKEWRLSQDTDPGVQHVGGLFTASNRRTLDITEPTDDLAKAWSGHRYGLQAIRPLLEPVIVFQKPYEGRPIDCMVETGAGALNIDECRIPGEPWTWGTQTDIRGGGYNSKRPSEGDVYAKNVKSDTRGRWPSNLILLDEEAAAALDAQAGKKKGTFVHNRTAGARVFGNNGKPTGYETVDVVEGEDGGASMYYFKVQEQIDEADPVYYCKKVGRGEREAGCEAIDEKLFGQSGGAQGALSRGGEEYQTGEDVSCGLNTVKKYRNNHPTLKPIALTEYLARLLLPPAAYAPRRLLVPFCGSGSEMIGGHMAGWDVIEGIDNDHDYITIADARLKYWTSKPRQLEF